MLVSPKAGASPRHGKPAISIVVASLNAAHTIRRCLDSIARQHLEDFEVLVVDGGSTDGTVDTLRLYSEVLGSRLLWTSEPDCGLADAWNKGVRLARGSWIIFLGADDRLSSPDVLSRVAPCLEGAFPRYRVVYGSVAMINAGGQITEWRDYDWSPARFRNCVENLPHSAVFHHSSLFSRLGPFDGSLPSTPDYDFLLRALRESAPLHLSDVVVADAQIGGLSTDPRRRLEAIRERIRIGRRHLGRLPPMMYWWIAKTFASWLIFQLGGESSLFMATNCYRSLLKRPPLRR